MIVERKFHASKLACLYRMSREHKKLFNAL
jgi:hypothetical protein